MPSPKPQLLQLSEEEEAGLEKLVKRHNARQQIAMRGRIVLAAGSGQNNSQIAREMGLELNTVRLWRQRWLNLQPLPLDEVSIEERLEDLPRPGAPARISADQICQITQMACEKPEASTRPISQWTAREIADEVQRRGIVEKISARHAARLLKRGGSQTASDPLLADARTG